MKIEIKYWSCYLFSSWKLILSVKVSPKLHSNFQGQNCKKRVTNIYWNLEIVVLEIGNLGQSPETFKSLACLSVCCMLMKNNWALVRENFNINRLFKIALMKHLCDVINDHSWYIGVNIILWNFYFPQIITYLSFEMFANFLSKNWISNIHSQLAQGLQ